jgi:arsenate reductase
LLARKTFPTLYFSLPFVHSLLRYTAIRMREEGIDLSGVKPQFLSEELARQATVLVTMGCGDACPYVPGLKKLDWPFPDPKGKSIETVRAIRKEIRDRVVDLGTQRNWLKPR